MKFKSNIEVQAGLEDASGSPGTVNQLLSSTVTGTTWIDPSTIVAEAATVVVIACKNTSGATIAKGTPVYQTGTVGATATIEIAPADALISTGDLPAIGLLQTALNNNGLGFVVISGALTNFTTSPIDGVVPVTGDKVFLKSGGGLTLTKPTTSLNGIQNLGLIGKVAVGNAGTITVSSIMRTNDVPNLPTGRTWVGNSNTEVSQTVYIDEPNLRLGVGTTSPDSNLEVAGSTGSTTYLHVRNDSTGSTRLKISNATDTNPNGFHISNNAFNGQVDLLNYKASTLALWTSSVQRMTILSGGSVGIGTTSPNLKLDVISGTNNGIRISATDTTNTWRDISIRPYVTQAQADALPDGTHFFTTDPSGSTDNAFSKFGGTVIQCRENVQSSFAIRLGTSLTTAFYINYNATATFSSTVTATNFILSSDERLKDNIKEIDTKHIDVNWKNFELKSEPGVKRTGVIAQELEETNPEFVRTDDEGMKSVAYIDLLIAKIAELEARLEKAGI